MEYKFSDSSSYKEPEYEFEEYEETGSIKDFAADRSVSGLAKKGIILFLVILYIGWYSAQNLLFLTGAQIEKSLMPHRIFLNMMNNPMLALIIFAAAAILSAMVMLLVGKYTKDPDRKFKLSDKDTHGSAREARDEDMVGAVTFKPLSRPEGVVLGRKIGAMNVLSNESHRAIREELAVCVDDTLSRNMNFAVFGSSGAGKSFSFARPNILTRISCGESYIVTDPSGELYRDTAELARRNGFDVKVLNLENFTASNGWNPFDVLTTAEPMEIQIKTATLVHTILTNTADDNAKGDVFYDQAEENLLKALVLYVAVSPHFRGQEYERHMGTVYDLLVKLAAQEGILEEFAELPDNDPATASWRMFQGSGKLKTNFITGLASKLEIFQTDIIKEIFSHSEIDLGAPGNEKCAIYVICPVMHDKMKFILSLFFSCAFEQLIAEANRNYGRLKVPTYFILDEFKAIGQINAFANKVSNVRKYGISLAIIFQDMNQLEQSYRNEYQSILSNCDTWLVLGVNDLPTAKMLSERIGIATTETEQVSYNKLRYTPINPINPVEGVRFSEQKRNLMTPDEVIRYFDNNGVGNRKAMILSRAKQAYLVDTYDWRIHSLAKYVMNKEYRKEPLDYIPQWQAEGNLTLNKPRSFETLDSAIQYGGKASGALSQKSFERNFERKAEDTAKKKGIVFSGSQKSDHLVEFGLDLSGKKR